MVFNRGDINVKAGSDKERARLRIEWFISLYLYRIEVDRYSNWEILVANTVPWLILFSLRFYHLRRKNTSIKAIKRISTYGHSKDKLEF